MRRFLNLGNLKVLTSIAPQLRELKVPTLIVWGEADTAFDLKSPEWLKDNIGGVQAPDHGAARETVLPRGASQADERAAAGVLAQHRVSVLVSS